MLINLRNAVMAGRRSPLPPGARWVEYLESTGTQYINTGFIGGSGTKVSIGASSNNTTSNMALFGARQTPNNRPSFAIWQLASAGGLRPRYDYNSDSTDSSVGSQTSWGTGDYTLITKDGRYNYQNATLVATNTNLVFALSLPFYLFAINTGGQASFPFVGKIYACKIYANGVLVRDFHPIAIGTTGYMLDMVSGKYLPYGNAGTGDFVLGPDIVPVEYIESHGTEYIDTGVKSENTIASFDIALRLRFTQVPNSGYRGSLYTTSNDPQFFYALNSNSATGLYMAFNGTTNIVRDLSAEKTAWHDVRAFVQGGNVVYIFDTVEVGRFAYTPLSLPAVFLFACSGNTGNVAPGSVGMQAIASFGFTINDVLVRSFQSVRVGSGSTWEGAMMDTLTRRIYRNAGTGAFAYGADLPLETLAD